MKSRDDFTAQKMESGRWHLVAHYQAGNSTERLYTHSHISKHSWNTKKEAEAFRAANTSWPVRSWGKKGMVA